MQERLGIAGSGTIACGLAVTAARNGDVLLWARSDDSAERARATRRRRRARSCRRGDRPRARAGRRPISTTSPTPRSWSRRSSSTTAARPRCSPISASWPGTPEPDAVLATTTSSLSIAELAQASGHPERFVGLHVFNPVPRMQLVELAFPPEASAETRTRERPDAVRGARQDRRSRSRTSPASSSTGCCSRTCSAPSS